ncbi:tudor and KH domain-containing protein homolog isoform X1 [Homarus americanus]|uniref:Tudor and KH domain-containing protein-like n=1 Tax=Homarus americanus TaxID=6706 RepID=A0A8J5TK58_HOMAM|nr:tudor and KH domain-containing protein homolog isoform X1 [Homarus americanus]KAG7177119.1 Tudor and KH domain-containing protein-like [Homarus americanus]
MDTGRIKNLILPLGGALLLSGVAGAVLYYITKKDEDEIKLVTARVNHWSTVQVQVPVDAVGLVIGRQGANIKLIQDRTNTNIRISDEGEEGHRLCVISGLEKNITLAQTLILKTVNEQPVIETTEMLVPYGAIGRVIGRNGESIRTISHLSGAKVFVDRDEDLTLSLPYPEDMRKIVLKGSKEQIEAARSLLLEKVVEDEEMRQQIHASATNMFLRARGRQAAHENVSQPSPMNRNNPLFEALSSTNSDRYIEAYVCAVDTASHFWLQVVGQRSVLLDKLVTEMTEYYESAENRELHELDKVDINSIVAAKFPHDNSWYRGQVCNYEHNETDPLQSFVTVYYVDFGDTETVKIDNVSELRTDFLKLNFQAIECFLANIKPESVKGDEAADVFEELTYAAQWKVVMVKVVGYQQAGEKTIPCVQIIDTNGSTDVDVAEELVNRGLAELTNGVSDSSSNPSKS